MSLIMCILEIAGCGTNLRSQPVKQYCPIILRRNVSVIRWYQHYGEESEEKKDTSRSGKVRKSVTHNSVIGYSAIPASCTHSEDSTQARKKELYHRKLYFDIYKA